jgi:hypothetical protein
VKKIYLVLLLIAATVKGFGQEQKKSRDQKRQERREHINELIKQEEEGALIYSKQSVFGLKLNTDGYGIFYEHGKYLNIFKTNLWWLELGEHKHRKEEKITLTDESGFFTVGNPYIFGKINNFYALKAGLGQQRLIGGKGNKNGVAVSAIYGGGLSAGLLKPYYITIADGTVNALRDIKYEPVTDSLFRDPTIIAGSAGFTKGFNNVQLVPGAHARVALRFDYGRYNELLSAIEVGLNAEYYSKNMQILLDLPGNKFFFNAYVSVAFGKRK